MAAVTTHRQPLEYLGGVRRFAVAEEKVSWSADYPEYQPADYTAPRVLAGPAWADPDIRSIIIIIIAKVLGAGCVYPG